MTEQEVQEALFKIRSVNPDMYRAIINIIKGFLKAMGIK